MARNNLNADEKKVDVNYMNKLRDSLKQTLKDIIDKKKKQLQRQQSVLEKYDP